MTYSGETPRTPENRPLSILAPRAPRYTAVEKPRNCSAGDTILSLSFLFSFQCSRQKATRRVLSVS
jgi:hypothetical protein